MSPLACLDAWMIRLIITPRDGPIPPIFAWRGPFDTYAQAVKVRDAAMATGAYESAWLTCTQKKFRAGQKALDRQFGTGRPADGFGKVRLVRSARTRTRANKRAPR